MDLGKLLFSVQGRINRGKFWLAILIYFVVNIVVGIIGYASGSNALSTLLGSIVGLVIFVSGIFVAIKRLHDRNRTGWWLLLFYIAPSVLFGIGAVVWIAGMATDTSGASSFGYLLFLAGFAISIWAFVELGCLRGTV